MSDWNSFLENVVNSTSIEEIIGGYVSLKKRGSNYVGLCPFHSERTASFTVSPTKNIYKCFGCGKAGNVFNFVAEIDSIK